MQTLLKIWNFVRKYSTLLLAGLLGLLFLASSRKTHQSVPSRDVNNNGKHDEEEIQQIKKDAVSHRKIASSHTEAAVKAVQPVPIVPSKTVREAVQRNNDVDY